MAVRWSTASCRSISLVLERVNNVVDAAVNVMVDPGAGEREDAVTEFLCPRTNAFVVRHPFGPRMIVGTVCVHGKPLIREKHVGRVTKPPEWGS